ncbi:MAG: HAMP domain-containing sensor histidine kinase, partial [Candidatus Promineifilaceae bacterium]
SRLESGLTEDDFQPVDFVELVQESAERFAAQADQTDLDFHLTLPAQPVTVTGSIEQLRRAVDNLLDNALKFTPSPGQIHLTLSDNDNWTTLVVEDSGIGIFEDDLPFIFHRFHRGRNTADYTGSGLGLAMVKTIIEHHRGYITVSSHPEQGTRVSVRLPVIS